MPIATAPAGPWALFRRLFVQHLVKSGYAKTADGLQIATSFQPALWDDPVYGTWLGWQRVANNIPVWGWSYRRSTGNRVTDAYLQFLANLDPGGGRQKTDRKAARTRRLLATVLTARDQGQDLVAEFRRAGAVSAERLGPGARHKQLVPLDARAVAARARRIETLSAAVEERSRRAGGASKLLGKAMLAYNNPAFQSTLVDDNGASGQFRNWSMKPDLSEFLQRARAGRAEKLDISIASRQEHAVAVSRLRSQPLAAGIALAGRDEDAGDPIADGFLRLGEDEGGTAVVGRAMLGVVAPRAKAEPYAFSLRTEGFAAIDIAPGRWFNRRVVRRFRAGPFLPDGPLGRDGAKLWGEGGVFPYLPARIFVGYRPSICASIGTSAFEATRDAWDRGLPVGVGPCEFKPRASDLEPVDESRFDEGKRTFDLTSNSRHAIILAVSNVVMPG